VAAPSGGREVEEAAALLQALAPPVERVLLAALVRPYIDIHIYIHIYLHIYLYIYICIHVERVLLAALVRPKHEP